MLGTAAQPSPWKGATARAGEPCIAFRVTIPMSPKPARADAATIQNRPGRSIRGATSPSHGRKGSRRRVATNHHTAAMTPVPASWTTALTTGMTSACHADGSGGGAVVPGAERRTRCGVRALAGARAAR